jgi:glucose-6-phosphate 1-dehydrogenase
MSNIEPAPTPPCIFVLFGASGDLAQRLLLPSLFSLALGHFLPDGFKLLGFAKGDWDAERFRSHIEESLRKFWGDDPPAETLRWLQERSYWQTGDFTNPHSIQDLATAIAELEKDRATVGNRLFHFAVAPDLVGKIARQLSEMGLCREEGESWRRLIVEKPFGNDLESAIALNAELRKELQERQIYRIDHFAGKDAVLDIPVFRFANTLFESVWNRDRIRNVQITAMEKVGVEERASFYEKSGALRDMVPNHLARILSIVAMEPPISLTAEHLGQRQAEVLDAVRPLKPEDVGKWVVRGQYGPGVIDHSPVPGYRAEHNVPSDSKVETYVAMRVMVDTWRWSGVPFHLRTGKRLAESVTEVVVTFHQPPLSILPQLKTEGKGFCNQIIFRLQPEAGISIAIGTKTPGLTVALEEGLLQFPLSQGIFGDHAKGYERLLHDCMNGDQKLFARGDMVEAGWRMVQPVLESWENAADSPQDYAAGSSGPDAADELLATGGHKWHSPEVV